MGKISKVLYMPTLKGKSITSAMAFYNNLSHLAGIDIRFTEEYVVNQEQSMMLHQKLVADATRENSVQVRVLPETAIIASSAVQDDPIFVVECE